MTDTGRQPVLASLCYLKKDDQTLMLHRIEKENDLHEGKWNGLGGKFDPGETPEECVRREVREEAGVELNGVNLRGILTFPRFDGVNDWYVFVFTSEDFQGVPKQDSREGRLEWIDDENLMALNLWEGDEIFLRWLQEACFFSGKFVYKNQQLSDYQGSFYPLAKDGAPHRHSFPASERTPDS